VGWGGVVALLASSGVTDRVGARVILFDQAGRVLLVAVTDPVDAHRIWMTPGGGRDDGETDLECARRELRAETGVTVNELQGPVCVYEHVFRWAGRMYRQRERFYVASMEGSAQGEASPDEIEQAAEMEARWWTLDELRTTRELVDHLAFTGSWMPRPDRHPSHLPAKPLPLDLPLRA
jgi:ADP-ribose pyrophosphatase YjhB (NUDIX family)